MRGLALVAHLFCLATMSLAANATRVNVVSAVSDKCGYVVLSNVT